MLYYLIVYVVYSKLTDITSYLNIEMEILFNNVYVELKICYYFKYKIFLDLVMLPLLITNK